MRKKFFMAVLLSVCIIALHGGFAAEMVCEAKTDASAAIDEKEAKEVEAFVTAFMEAHTKDNLDALEDFVEDTESLPEYLVPLEVYFEYGMIKYDNIDADAYPMQDGEYWLVWVYSDMIIGDENMALPGGKLWVVHRKGDGSLKMIINYYDNISDEMLEELEQLALTTDEIIDKHNECAMKYNAIVEENQEVMEWLLDVQYAVEQALREAAAEAAKQDAEQDTAGVYTVKKGDCLWNIAKEQLGDGMYWNEIYETNRNVIGDNPDLLYVGIRIRIEK